MDYRPDPSCQADVYPAVFFGPNLSTPTFHLLCQKHLKLLGLFVLQELQVFFWRCFIQLLRCVLPHKDVLQMTAGGGLAGSAGDIGQTSAQISQLFAIIINRRAQQAAERVRQQSFGFLRCSGQEHLSQPVAFLGAKAFCGQGFGQKQVAQCILQD